MKIVQEIPKRTPTAKTRWDRIADLLNGGKILKFSKGDDFQGEPASFRPAIYSSMSLRGISVRTVIIGSDVYVERRANDSIPEPGMGE